MPKVPTYEPGQVSASTARPPAIRNRAVDQTGPAEALGRAGEQFGKMVSDIQRAETKKADDAQFELAAATLGRAALDAEAAGRAGKGLDAPTAQDTALETWGKTKADALGKLNPRVAPRASAFANAQELQLRGQLNTHGAQQHEVVSEFATKSAQDTALAAVAAHASSPDAETLIAEHTQALYASMVADIARKGLLPKNEGAARSAALGSAKAAVEQAVTTTRLDALLADRSTYPSAIALFERDKNKLGQKQDEYTKKVQAANYTVQEIQQSDQIIAKYGAGPAGIAQAGKIGDEVLRERVEKRIDAQRIRDEAQTAATERALIRGAIGAIDLADAHTPLTDTIGAVQQAALQSTPRAWEAVQDHHAHRLANTEADTDPAVTAKLGEMQANSQWDKLAAVNLNDIEYLGKLNNAQKLHWAEAIKNSGDPSKRVGYQGRAAAVRQGYLDGNLVGEGKAKQRDQLQSQFDAAVSAFEVKKGAPASDPEMKAIMAPLLRRVVQPGFFSNERRAFRVPPEERAGYSARIGDTRIPMVDYQQIVNAYTINQGHAPTEQEIVDTYKARTPAGK